MKYHQRSIVEAAGQGGPLNPGVCDSYKILRAVPEPLADMHLLIYVIAKSRLACLQLG